MGTLHRLTVSIVVASVVAMGWSIAPAHAHLGHHDDHDQPTMHRHVVEHAGGHAHHSGTEVEENSDEGTVWLDDAIVVEVAFEVGAPIAVPLEAVDLTDIRPTWFPKARNAPTPAHGPPRAPVPVRGPPHPSCLI